MRYFVIVNLRFLPRKLDLRRKPKIIKTVKVKDDTDVLSHHEREVSSICKENRIYIRGEFTRKKCRTAILLYCFHTAGVLHIFILYNLLGPGISFYRKSKINIKRKPNNGFLIDQCPFHIDCMPFTLQTMIFRYNYKSNDVFIHLLYYKVFLTASKNSKLKWIV